ncbi:RNA polymerase [Meliandou lophuromys virus]|uniref:RNA-directed RNA polymerase L n=1 Tax=Meliandou lophuromys virus TaxID=2940986 RepID=A0AAE9HTZ3_9MONO|nr:RNA polymerase [Meliandou lophuromys virus]
MAGTSLSDILYPECHLNSPIVTGKLVELILITRLPNNQPLDDQTLVNNIKLNLSRGYYNPLILQQRQFYHILIKKYPNLKLLRHIPYPNGNKYLFNLTHSGIFNELKSLLSYAHSCYRKISDRLVHLVNSVESGLGENHIRYKDVDEHRKASIINLPNIMESSIWYKPFLLWFTLKKEMRLCIKQSTNSNARGMYPNNVFDLEGLYVQYNRNLLLIINKFTNEAHYLTFEMVLMMSDVLEGRLMIDLAMNADLRYTQFKTRGYLLWEFIDNLFCDLGNETYNIVALIEPLVLGFLQLHDESYLLKGAFLQFCLTEITNEFNNLGFSNVDDHEVVINTIYSIFDLEDLHMIAEFFSFFRTFGHPTLEAEEAAAKVRAHMNKPKVIKFKTMMKGHALFCGTIINGFRDRHGGSWPPVIFPNHVSKRVRQLQLNSEGITDEICITEWRSFVGFKFRCFMPLTLDEDLTMYMKDKALASVCSEWDSVYPRETMGYTPPKQTTSRRLVEVFLNDDKFDPVNLINYVLSGEYLNDDEFNLSYSLKEKEIKKVGRLFAKMTYKMRACQVVAESLIATGVGKYFKENGMVKDEHELLKTLHKLSVSSIPKDNKVGHKSEKLYTQDTINKILDEADIKSDIKDTQYETISTFLTTDLQKFCLNWRQETTNLFAQRLNEIYGLPGFFNWLHKRLEKSVLYVADPHCPPSGDSHIPLSERENDQIFIKYPMGGIEGYCQKLWTIITIPFLFLSAYEVGARIAAVVQGDNQAIAITKRVHPNLPFRVKKIISSQLAQKYFDRLRSNLFDIGHNLKANETIVSSHFFVYSKRIYYDGLVLSQALKPISRAVFWSETIVDETRSACSNISTAISKSIEQGYSKWIGYNINILKTIEQLVISLSFTINPSMTKDIIQPLLQNPYWLICASLIPSQLGGFNYMNMCRLYVRNIGDPVTASIADVKRMIKVRLLNKSILQKIIHQKPGDNGFLDWASDPYSVNLPHSQSISMMLKNVTSRMILQHSDNPMLKGLFHFDFEQEDRDLASFLLDRPIIIPRAAHEIMDKSLTGARQEIAGMLDSTKGLIRNSLKSGGVKPRLTEKLSTYDYEQFRTFNNLMNNKKNDDLITHEACSVELAILLRKRMWYSLAKGRPIYGLEVPDIIEAVNGYTLKDCEDCYYCQAQSKEYGWFFVPRNCHLDAVHEESNQMRVPYFGSTTEERSEIKLSSLRSASRALKAAVRIATVYTWAYGDDDDSWAEAWYLASFRAKLTLDELKAITPISTSNNIAHRLKDKSTQMKYSGNTLNRVSRYTIISNDKLNFIINGRKVDTNLVYQQIMLLGLSILESRFRFQSETGKSNTVLHLHIVKNCCVIEMEDHPYTSSLLPLPNLIKVECNRLIYDETPIIDHDTEQIHKQLYNLPSLDFPRWTLSELNEGLAQSLAMTIVDILTKENKDHLTEFKVFSNDDDMNSLITEFMLVDPSLLTLHIGLSIAINWSYNIYYRRPEGKYQMIEYLYTIMIQSPKSYFSVLANALSHPQIFNKFWDAGYIEPIYGPNISSQDFIRIAIDYMVLCYSTYLNFWTNDESIQYLLTEFSEEIIEQRFEIVQSKHLCMLNNLYNQRSDMPIIRGLTSIEKCTVLTDALKNAQFGNPGSISWNLDLLEVVAYPASLTYLRRGTIKHIRLRNVLNRSIMYINEVKFINQDINVAKGFEDQLMGYDRGAHYFPITYLFTDDFRQLLTKQNFQPAKNRWECHIQRRIGLNSTSCYKAVEIGLYLKDKINLNGDRLFLGEGSGAMMTTYYAILGQALCYYNTGVFSSEVIGQRVLTLSPSEAYLVAKNNPNEMNLRKNIVPLFNGKPESTWIGNPAAFVYISNSIKPHSLSMIHNDMESSFEKDTYTIACEQCHSLALALNLGKSDSVYITKLAPRPNDYTYVLLDTFQIYYEEVFCFLPMYSNPYSSEMYIICSVPRNNSLVYPDLLMKYITKSGPSDPFDLQNTIINFKLTKYFERRTREKLYGDFCKSTLNNLSNIDKILIRIGFSLNGPKLIKQMTGHDVGTGSQSLISSIQLLANSLVTYLDPERDKSYFFEPYPLKMDSKVKEMIETISIKIIIYYLVYHQPKSNLPRNKYINCLRKKYIYHDLMDEMSNAVIPKYLLSKLKKTGYQLEWREDLDASSIKVWWKIVGYSMLIDEN